MLADDVVGEEGLGDDEEFVVADELGEEELHPALDDLLEDDEVGLDEGRGEDLHDLLLLPTAVARHVEEHEALDGGLEKAAHERRVWPAPREPRYARRHRLEAGEEVAEDELGLCERDHRQLSSRGGLSGPGTHP